MAAQADVARDAMAIMDALVDMCDQYLATFDGKRFSGYEHMCMTAGEGVEELFGVLGIDGAYEPLMRFTLDKDWRELLAKRWGMEVNE